ncbi:MAG: hypothetical protein M0033_02100 [Nitrospiraceae bacterium]|nr:hypothetical protein [Nitrospiraceae bacterium]MDA8324990.1 hypothetical protein [Nitrospiraceae bacterium]
MRGKIANKAVLIGAGAGVVCFLIFGLLPGSFLGGVTGLNIAGLLFGYPVSSAILPRLIVAASMLLGIMVSGVIFVVGGSLIGWFLGTVFDSIAAPKAAKTERKIKV